MGILDFPPRRSDMVTATTRNATARGLGLRDLLLFLGFAALGIGMVALRFWIEAPPALRAGI